MKAILVTSTLAASFFLAIDVAGAATAEEPVDKYQIAVSDGRIVMVDTCTGQCWSKSASVGGEWIDHGSPAEKVGVEKVRRPLALDLPRDTVGMIVRQRGKKAIVGSDGRIRVHLDDITAGRTLLSVRTDDGHTLLDETVVRRGDIVAFDVANHSYFIKVVELVNQLVGDDVAELRISADRRLLEDAVNAEPRTKPHGESKERQEKPQLDSD